MAVEREEVMFELKGKFNTAKVFTDVIDQESISQVMNLLNQEFTAGSKIRMMPDVHAGAGCTIGTTMTLNGKVCPSAVGVDIGCGMEVAILRESSLDVKLMDEVVCAKIPSGMDKRTDVHPLFEGTNLTDLRCRNKVNFVKAANSFGTLGGGNHFIEANRDEDGRIYIVIHSGSRHLGIEVEKFYRKKAVEQMSELDTQAVNAYIQSLKKAGMNREIPAMLNNYYAEKGKRQINPELAYISGYLFDDYIHDMRIVQSYAQMSRMAMMDEILSGMGLHMADSFSTIHNYIDTDNMILRKGAVSAQAGERLIIPINMRDGSLICVGKGNPDWNYSAPHGAGRLMSRGAAKAAFTVAEFKEQMKGIYTTSVGAGTLHECPMAYKKMEDIVENISPTADILHIIKPIYNFKAGKGE